MMAVSVVQKGGGGVCACVFFIAFFFSMKEKFIYVKGEREREGVCVFKGLKAANE